MIRLQGLSRRYSTARGTVTAVDDVTLEVTDGETCVLLGPSGCGKTTTLRMINRLVLPSSGKIFIAGRDTDGIDPVELRRGIGYVIQQIGLFPNMTVAENIAFPLREAGEREPKVLREKVREILDVVELEGQEEKMPVSLSGGMKKRVGLARSIIRRPKCVLYDEPTSGLDPVVSDSINRLIRRLQERFGMTSIVVTHDMKSAFDVADHIAYLHEGRIYFYGTPIQLQQTSDPILQDFLLGRSAEERGSKVES